VNRLFLRLLLVVTLTVLGASVAAVGLIDYRYSPAENTEIEVFVAPGLARLASRIGAGEPTTQVIADGQQGVGKMLAVLDGELLEFTPAQRVRLNAGEVVIRGTGSDRSAFAAVPGQDLVVELLLASRTSKRVQWANLPGLEFEVAPLREPLSPLDEARLRWRPVPARGGIVIATPQGPGFVETPRLTSLRRLSLGLMILGLGLALLVSLAPVQRQLVALASQAERLREGELSARVPVQGRGSGALGEVAQQFNAMADRVEALVRSQEELLMSASHELQTPLARLMFSLDALRDEDADRDEILTGMRLTVDQMRILAEELLEFNRLGRGREHLVDLVVLDVAELVGDLAESAGARAVIDGPVWAHADARLLYRALRNLVENAFAYATPPELVVEREGDWILVHVDDAGAGIPEESRRRIFEPFHRVEGSRARATGGTGLGLAIVERVCQRLGGEVSVTESPDGGARFTVGLRAAEAPSGQFDDGGVDL